MPRVSQRQREIRFVKNKLELNIALCSSSSDEDSISRSENSENLLKMPIVSGSDLDIMESSTDSEDGGDNLELEGQPKDLFDIYCVMEGTRYFVDRDVTSKSKDFVINYFAKLPDLLFRQLTRMDKRTFFSLLQLIEEHPVFHNKSPCEQAPIVWQLAVTLDRLGHDGNGACLNHMIPTWGVSNGSLINFTNRCFTALDEVLCNQIMWPNTSERQAISEEFAKRGFPGCVGLIDGTLIPLSQRPKVGGECYYDRKCRYSINAQVVCDHRRKFLYMYSGMPGSCADLTCFRRSRLYGKMDDEQFFAPGQYLLGDSGYQIGPAMVCSFKNCYSLPEKESFNLCVAKCRVTNEHCIGVLKTRWFSLKELRMQLKSEKDNLWAIRWLGVCAKLHNFVISQNDEWSERDQEVQCDENEDRELDEFLTTLPPVTLPQREEATGQALRRPGAALLRDVMEYALQFHKQPGGCLNEYI